MATTKLPPVFNLKFQRTKSQVVLHTMQDVAKWYSEERAYWGWLESSEVQANQQLREFGSGWLGNLDRCRSLAQVIATNQEQSQTKNNLETLKARTATLQGWYLPSSSPEAAFVQTLVNGRSGTGLAAASLATLSHWPLPNDNGATAQKHQVTEGVVAARLFTEGISPNTNAAVKESIEKTIGELSGRSAEIREEYDKFSLGFERWAEDYQASAIHDAASAKTERAQLVDQLRNEFESLRSEIENVRKTYEEHMALEGPVKYWTDRSNIHNSRFRFFVGGVALAVVVSIGFVGGVYYLVAGQISGSLTSDHLLYAAIALLASTAGLWLVRVVLKILLSERHLRNNAEEKAMMIQTYLAMTKIGQASKEDRQIVLTAIFNTSADGIVKDDGAPDISMSALLSKYFAK